MKIVHLSTSDGQGGAALAAYRVHTGLTALGVESRLFVLNRHTDDKLVKSFNPPHNRVSRLSRYLYRRWIQFELRAYQATRPAGYELFTDDRSEIGVTLLRQLPPYDLINLHWVAGFIDYRSFFTSVPQRVPIVWRIADMNPLTGGCHYDDGCGRFVTGCGACPQLGSSQPNDLSAQIWARKWAALRNVVEQRLHIVATSQWVATLLRQSPLFARFSVTHIPNSVDTDKFMPRDKNLARDVFGISPAARVILFVADSVANRRKGFDLLLQALSDIDNKDDVVLLSVGRGKPQTDPKVRHIHVAYTTDERLHSLIYSAADLFIIPSLQESFGQTIIEAMACGIPVVGFATGGIPDMVQPGVTGLLVPTGNVELLRGAITQLLSDPQTRAVMGHNARRIAVQEYAVGVQARRYLALYERCLEALVC